MPAALKGAWGAQLAALTIVALLAYALLLPPMRADLQWSYTLAGAMNTANALGYLLGALAVVGLSALAASVDVAGRVVAASRVSLQPSATPSRRIARLKYLTNRITPRCSNGQGGQCPDSEIRWHSKAAASRMASLLLLEITLL